jgi:sugar phosphate permease
MPAALFGMFFYLSIYLQQVLQYSPTKTGLADVPFTLVMILVAGFLSKKISSFNPKLILVFAPLVVAGGLAFFARIPVHANYLTDVLPGIVLMAAGMAAVFVTNTMVTTSGVSHKESGLISGLLNTSQQVGGALGLAVLSVVSTATTKHDITAAHGNPAITTTAVVHGFQRGFMAAAIFAVIACVVALVVLKIHKPTKDDIDQEAETEAESLAAVPGA